MKTTETANKLFLVFKKKTEKLSGTCLDGDGEKIKVLGHQHQWLVGGYDLEIEHF